MPFRAWLLFAVGNGLMWVKGAYHAHACVFKNATAAGWGAASSCSSTAEPMGQAECVRARARERVRFKSPALTVSAPLSPSVTSVASHRRGGWGLRVYMRM